MLTLRDIYKSFGSKPVLNGVSFEVQTGEIVALLGESGSGKSTLLSIIAGLETADRGQVLRDGADMAAVPVHERGFGLMFQDYALFPHRNVYGNVAFGLQMASMAPDETAERVQQALALVELEDFADRDVAQLSGGEQQRVALARALAPQPRLLMLDEPLGSLDKNLRGQLVASLRSLLKAANRTSLYVTHDQEEAFAIADRVVILKAGRVEQHGTPREIYLRPASVYVARFLGFENIFTGDALPLAKALSAGKELLLRPDAVTIGEAGPVVLEGKLVTAEFRGLVQRAVVQLQNGTQIAVDTSARVNLPEVGKQIKISFDPKEAIQVFGNE
jgi:ABC-type Fe3+/spermidine/putrescine transport system ATPase subunit